MDVAASAVSLIQFTLKGLKIIHQTFSSLQDGPETTKYIVHDAADLIYILERLKESPAAEISKHDKLGEVLRHCEKDVTEIATLLDSLNFKKEDRKWGKLWKSVKIAFDEKKLRDMDARLKGYLNSLNVFVTMEDSDKLFEIDDKMTLAHNSIGSRLIEISQKLGELEEKCDAVGGAARDQKLQEKIEFLRQACEEMTSSTFAQPPFQNLRNGSAGLIAYDDACNRLEKGSQAQVQKQEEEVAEIQAQIKQLSSDITLLKSTDRERQLHTRYNTQNSHQSTVIFRELLISRPNFSIEPVKMETTVAETHKWTTKEVLANSQSLEIFYNVAHIRLTNAPSGILPTTINRRILSRLVAWSQAFTSSEMLWLQGPSTPSRNTQNNFTRVGLKLVKIAHKTQPKINMISFFCSQDGYRESLIAVVYALIRQLLPIVVPLLEKDIDLSEDRYQRLDGTKKTLDDAFQMLEDLVRYISQAVFCIIDGVQLLDQRSPIHELRRLLNILRHEHIHVLLISSGASIAVQSFVQRENVLSEMQIRNGNEKEDLGRHSYRFWQEKKKVII